MNPNETTAATTSTTKQSRLRFSLRAMLAGIAVIACCFGWLGAEWKVVHARRSAWQRIEGNGGIVSACYPGQWSGVFLPNGVHVRPRKPLSWIRTKLGDLPVMGILLSTEDSSSSSVEQIRQLFPEAAVVPEQHWKNPPWEKKS